MSKKRDDEKLTWASVKDGLKRQMAVLAAFVGLIIVIQVVNAAMGGWLTRFGVHPRALNGLWGIILHPLLHGSFGHVLSNSIGILIFGVLLMLRSEKYFWIVTGVTTVVGGLGIWLVGASSSVHVGASGVIFGYFGYLLLTGFFERRVGSILLSVFIGLGWGGMIFGVLPGQLGISWEGHLFGFLGGVLCAKLLARKKKPEDPAKGLLDLDD